MIAVCVGSDMRMVVVGAPAYFAKRKKPKTPQDPTDHVCTNLRLPTLGGVYACGFEKGGREMKMRVNGQLVLNNLDLKVSVVLARMGIAHLPEDQVALHVGEGRLVCVVDALRYWTA